VNRFTVLFACSVAFSASVSADMFGRLFTTPEGRAALDVLRYQKEVSRVEIDLEPEPDADDVRVEDTEMNMPIRLKGVVHRKNGNSAVWINESSTLRGDIALENLEIKTDDVSSSQVEVVLPGVGKSIKLKVGESYLPTSGEKLDVIPESP